MGDGALGDFTMRKIYQIEIDNPLRSGVSHDEVRTRSRSPSFSD